MPTDESLEETLDARGLKCPLPVLKAEKRLAALPAGGRLLVLTTDPMARVDLPLFCRQHGYSCAESRDDAVWRFTIGKPA